jgi:hypothetical protein
VCIEPKRNTMDLSYQNPSDARSAQEIKSEQTKLRRNNTSRRVIDIQELIPWKR